MSVTIKNLRDVDDSAVKFGVGDRQAARFPQRDLGAEATGFAFIEVKPGQRQPFAHRHENAEEIYVILAGSGRLKADDDVHDVGPLDAIRFPPGVARAFEAGPDGLTYLAFGAHHEGDGELLEEAAFWD